MAAFEEPVSIEEVTTGTGTPGSGHPTGGGRVTVIGPGAGDILGPPNGVRDRFLLDAAATGGAMAVVEHLLPPRTLAGPMHLHTREDEYSYVLEGRVGVRLGDVELVAEPDSFVVKPRGQWHTFWNAGDEPARLLELIVPGGLEQLFRTLDTRDGEPEPDELARMGAAYGARIDMEATVQLIERLDLRA